MDITSDLLKKGKNAFENLVDELPLGVISCDREGNITAVNDFLLKIIGSPSAEATKNVNLLTYPPLVESGISATITKAITTGKNASIETAYRSMWGKELFLSFRAFPLKGQNGEVSGCHAIVEDLTSERDANTEIESNKLKDILIEKISGRFINSNFNEIDASINTTLKDLGYFTGAEQVALFSVDKTGNKILKTHEWHVDGLIPKIILNEKRDAKALGFEELSTSEITSISEVDKLPDENKLIRQLFQNMGMKSVAVIPLSRHGIFKGFLGVDSKSKPHVWSENDLHLLKIVGDMIINILDRKKSEILLLEKEKEYEKTINSLDAIIWKATYDYEGNALQTYISKPMDKLLGFPEGTIGNDWDRFFAHIHPADIELVQENLKYLFRNPDSARDIDYRVISDNGIVTWVNTLGTSYQIEDGIFQLVGTTSNITERKIAEENVARSEERYRSLIERLSDAVIINTFEGKILEVNDKTCEMLGYSRNELQNMTIYDLMPSERRDTAKKVMSEFMKDGTIQAESEFVTVDGKLLLIEVNAKALEGYPNTAQAIVRDITERKHAEERLAESEEKLRLFIEHAPAAIVMLDRDMRHITVSRRWLENTDHTEENIIGLPHYQVYPFLSEEVKEAHQRALNGEIVYKEDDNMEQADGSMVWASWEVRPWKTADGSIGGIIIFSENTTKRKETEIALRNRESQLHTLINTIPDLVWQKDVNGVFLSCNAKFEEFFGAKEEEIVGKTDYDFIDKELADQFRQRDIEALDAGGPLVNEELITYASDGHQKYLETRKCPMYDPDGKPIGIVGVGTDITERKQNEEKLRESEALLNEVGEIAKIGGWEYDVASGNGRWTTEIYNIHEIEHNSDIIVADTFNYYTPDSRKIIEKAFKDAIEKAEPYDLELEFITPKGSNKWIRTSGRPTIENGKVVKVTGSFQDITERKIAENKLFESEEKLRLFVEHAPAELVMLDRDMRHIAVSRRWADLVSLSPEEIIGTYHYDLLPHLPEYFKDAHRRALRGEIVHKDDDYVELHDGSIRWNCWEVRPWRTADGTIGGIILFSEDVTDRKKAEITLKENETLLNEVGILAKVGGWEYKVATGAVKWTPEIYKIFDLKPDFKPAYGNTMKLYSSDSRKSVEKAFKNAIEKAEAYDLELEITTPQGNHKWIRTIGHPTKQNGKVDKITGSFQDITERKTAENKLFESEEKLRLFIEQVPASIAMLDCDMRHIAISHRWLERINRTKEEVIGRSHYELYPMLTDEVKEAHQRSLKGEIVRKEEDITILPDGSNIWSRWESRPWKTTDGNIGGIVIYIEDITERKQTQDKLRDSEALLSEVGAIAKIGGWKLDLITNDIKWTTEIRDIFELDTDEVFDIETVLKYIYPVKSRERLENAVYKLIEKGEPYDIEAEFISEKGTRKWVRTMANPVIEDNKIVKITGTLQDITTLKEAELKLFESEEKLRLFIEHAPAAIAMLDRDAKYIAASRRWMTDFSLGEQDISGMTHYEMFPEINDELKAVHQRAMQGEIIRNDEDRFERTDGTIQWLRWEVRPWKTADGDIGGIIIFLENITERKKAENELRKNEALLNEVGRIGMIGGWELDVATNMITFTPEVARIHETEEIDTYDKAIERFISGSRPMLEKATKNAIEKAEPFDLELEIESGKGKHKWVRASARPKVVDGKTVKITGTLQDITKRKEMEQELLESHEKYQMLSDATFEGIIFHDNGIVLDANESVFRATGYTREEIIGKNILKIAIYPDDRDIILEKVKTDSTKPYEVRCIRKDGSVFPIEIESYSISYKGKKVRVAAIRDITERKKAETELKESEERFKVLHNASFGGIAIHDIKHILDCNLGLSEITGYSYEELVGMDGLSLIAEPYRDTVIENIARHYEEPYEVIGLRKDGSEYPLQLEGKVIPYKGKKVGVAEFRDITEQKKAEEELKESEERFKALHNASFGGIAIHDKGVILDCNQGLSDITGYSHEDLIGMNGLLLIAENYRDLVMSNILAGYEEPYEVVGRRKDGSEYPLRLEARGIPYKGKKARVVEFRDITEQKKAEEKLHEKTEELERYFTFSLDLLCIADAEGRFVRLNPEWEKVLGYSISEMEGHYFIDFVHPADKEITIESHIKQSTQTHTVRGFENRYRAKDGTYRWIEWRSTQVGDFIYAAARDVTKRKEAEEELIRSEDKYRSLFERSNDAIMIHDFDGQIIDVNSKVCEILGYTEEELKHRSIMDLVLPADKHQVIQKINKIKLNGTARTESRMVRADGKIIFMDLSGSLIQTHGELIQSVGRDITERIQAETDLLKAKIEAETASRTKSEFLTNMSHELRTPLNSIIGFSDIMLDGIVGKLDPKQEHYVDHISSSGRHLLTLINDILDISKVEAGKMDLFFEKLNVEEAITEVVNITGSLRTKKDIDIDVDIAEKDLYVIADKPKLKQIMYNLIGNAIKFTPDKGKVTIHAEVDKEMLRVSVIDTGIGISAEDQNKLFKPFSQIDSSISRKYQGTGLGLALVKELVELHRGKIWVESEPEKGSNFTFEIPIYQARR